MLENSIQIKNQSMEVIKILQEALGGIRDLILDNTQKIYCDIYESADKKLRYAQSNILVISICPRYVIEALGMVGIAALAYFVATHSNNATLTIPIIGTLAFAAQRMLPTLQLAYSSWSSIRGGQEGISEALRFLEQPLGNSSMHVHCESISFEREITLKNVSFHYENDQQLILHDINFTIPKFSCVGIFGTTGSGKSTLLDIIMGLLTPTKGELIIDGKPLSQNDLRSWQAHVAHVPQSIFLADISLAENIAFGIPKNEIDLERVQRCAHAAQIGTTICSWPDQFDTVVGERGIRLSGGQKQRIGIARALYKGAKVIILDEATSALDIVTENAVMNSINRLNEDLTIIIVAHRLSTLKNCTQVIEINSGKVVRIGSYKEVIDTN